MTIHTLTLLEGVDIGSDPDRAAFLVHAVITEASKLHGSFQRDGGLKSLTISRFTLTVELEVFPDPGTPFGVGLYIDGIEKRFQQVLQEALKKTYAT
jgi:hypothetical protein